MYIKQIIIQGFKSYKDQTVIEPFSPKHNVIVGRNGSGKSNFFAAIRFALSDAYTQMGREERQALLHEGAGTAVMSAYVEIIFDNEDDRFHTGNPELILRRTIGQKKDEYSLDRKNATKADVMNLLESAGFSRSNPYYIVPQGRVTALTNMKDGERLNLLKEVAGTQVYEARRTESVRIMSDTDSKRAKIDELLGYIGERLDELEEDKKELQDYRDKDRERRCLEYTIYHREQDEINKAIESLEQAKENGVDEMAHDNERLAKVDGALSAIENEMKSLRQQSDLLRLDKKQYSEERGESARQKAKLELDLNTVTEGQGAAQTAQAQRLKDIRQVQADIQTRETLLAELIPRYTKAKAEEEKAKAQLNDAETKRQRLFGKQGRSAGYKSKSERDAWLQKEIKGITEALATRKTATEQTAKEISGLESEVLEAETEVARLRTSLESHGKNQDTINAIVQQAQDAKNKLLDQRKELWREDAKLDSILANTRNEMDKATKTLSHMMDQNTSRGIAAVRHIKETHKLEGVYGTVAELFTVSDRYKTAVEVTANNSLFHYVVDNDETASQILDILNEERSGRVTFMPLNRLRHKNVNLPQANDALDMMTKIQFDPKFEPAMRQIFGRTIICPNLQIAAQYARSHGIDAITPDGDRSDNKGALSGGYHDTNRSRLTAAQALAKLRDEHDQHRHRKDEIGRDLERLNQEVTKATTEVQKAEQRVQQSENSYGPMQQELRGKTLDLHSKRDRLEAKQRTKSNQDADMKLLSEQKSAYEADKASDFKKDLSTAEEAQLEALSSSLPNLQKEHREASKALSELEVKKSTTDVELRESLRPRLEQLQTVDEDSGAPVSANKLKELQRELKRLNKKVEDAETKLKEADDTLEAATAQITDLERRNAEYHTQKDDIKAAIQKHTKRSEKGIAKRALMAEKAAEVAKNIRDLGSLPDEAYERKYTRLPSDQAIKKLHAVNESLKKYSHVNKKAFEQYSNFTSQREGLTKRRKDLNSSQNAIRELIDVLDQRKDEAIERTFKQVSKEFASIFERLVPAGRGRLIIQRRTDPGRMDAEDDEDEDERVRRSDGVENYAGVGIAVSFNSKFDEQQRIQQLSGGQKSLCALALVFAIQQCDPAPFYLFDEIDANLDAQYRTAVAGLLQEISASGQFICTTFRPEMVHVAEKCYGVSYSKKTSTIDVVEKEEALEFIEGVVGGN